MKALLIVPALVVAAALGALTASCGSDGDATPAGPVPSVANEETITGSTTVEVPPSTTTSPEGETVANPGVVTYQVWWANSDGLFVTYRTQEKTLGAGTAAFGAVLEGPEDFEQDYGLTTSFPEGTQLLGLVTGTGIARVDLPPELELGGCTASW